MIYIQHPGSNKHNFIDKHDCYVGFEVNPNCCEHAIWYISDHMPRANDEHEEMVEIPEYFKETFLNLFFTGERGEDSWVDSRNDYYKNIAWFEMANQKKTQIHYLCLVNMHNGYYSHGFEFRTLCGNGLMGPKGFDGEGAL